MSEARGDGHRLRKVLRLRRAWRRDAADPDPSAAAGGDDEGLRRSETLDSNDRIRAEAPDDLETRRRADQLEREIKRRD